MHSSQGGSDIVAHRFFALYFPYYAVEDPSTPALPKTLSCIFAPTCMAVTSSVFTSFESGQIGVQPGNVFTTAGNISYATCIAMLCFDCVLYVRTAMCSRLRPPCFLPSANYEQLPACYALLPGTPGGGREKEWFQGLWGDWGKLTAQPKV